MVMPSIVVLSVVMLSVVMLAVVAPKILIERGEDIQVFWVGSFNSKLGCLGYKGQCMPVMNTATCRTDINYFIT